MKINVRLSLKALIVSFIFVMFIVQIAMQKTIGALSYYDEFITIVSILYLIYIFITSELSNETKISLTLIVILVVIGLFCNIQVGVQTKIKAILMDIGNMFKVYIVFLMSCEFFKRFRKTKNVIKYLNFLVRLLILPGVALAVINLFVDIDMYTEYVYGIRAFHYIFHRVGNLNSVCIACMIVMTIAYQDMNYRQKKVQRIFILMDLLLMISTLRTRAVVFALVYLAEWYIFKNGGKFRIKWSYVTAIAVVGTYLALPKLQFYFSDDSEAARGVLLRYGIRTASNYFPLGTGFGSYGTFAAKTFWSPLYTKYKFNQYYGLSEEDSSFLTDDYWPAIIAEFGFIGALVMLGLLVFTFRTILEKTKNYRAWSVAAMYGILCTTISSTVSSSFFNPANISIMSLVGMAVGISERKRIFEETKNRQKVQQNDESEQV